METCHDRRRHAAAHARARPLERRRPRLLSTAGLAGVAVEEIAVPLRAGSPDEWWARTCALSGPLAERLAALPEAPDGALRARATEAGRAYERPAGLELP